LRARALILLLASLPCAVRAEEALADAPPLERVEVDGQGVVHVVVARRAAEPEPLAEKRPNRVLHEPDEPVELDHRRVLGRQRRREERRRSRALGREGAGALERHAVEAPGAVAAQRAALTPADQKALARLGVRLGTETVYIEPLLKPAAVALRALLWSVKEGIPLPAPVPPPGRLSLPRDPAMPDAYYAAIGYHVLGPRALRVDRVERLAAAARRLARQGAFAANPELSSLVGCPMAELAPVLVALGYRAVVAESGVTFVAKQRRREGARRRAKERRPKDDTPFAKLKMLKLGG
jgi:hypothetical protein